MSAAPDDSAVVDHWHLLFLDYERLKVEIEAPGYWKWCRWATRPGFRHVVACNFNTKHDAWLVAETNLYRSEIVIADQATIDFLWTAARVTGGAIVRVPVRNRCIFAFRPALYCVTAAAHLIGVRTWAVTPWQLFNRVRRIEGAVVVHYEEAHVV